MEMMADRAWKDEARRSYVLERVEVHGSCYTLGFDGGVCCGLDKSDLVIPQVGDRLTLWGTGGLGSVIRGQAINDVVVWYRSEEEDRAHHIEQQRHANRVCERPRRQRRPCTTRSVWPACSHASTWSMDPRSTATGVIPRKRRPSGRAQPSRGEARSEMDPITREQLKAKMSQDIDRLSTQLAAYARANWSGEDLLACASAAQEYANQVIASAILVYGFDLDDYMDQAQPVIREDVRDKLRIAKAAESAPVRES